MSSLTLLTYPQEVGKTLVPGEALIPRVPTQPYFAATVTTGLIKYGQQNAPKPSPARVPLEKLAPTTALVLAIALREKLVINPATLMGSLETVLAALSLLDLARVAEEQSRPAWGAFPPNLKT